MKHSERRGDSEIRSRRGICTRDEIDHDEETGCTQASSGASWAGYNARLQLVPLMGYLEIRGLKAGLDDHGSTITSMYEKILPARV